MSRLRTWRALASGSTFRSFAPRTGAPCVMMTFFTCPPSQISSSGRTPISSSWYTTDEPSGFGTSPSRAATNAVPIDGCPAKGISPPGVKMRLRYWAAGFVEGKMNVVSERFISRAIAAISAGRRPVARGNTASGFPVRGVSVKTSTRQKSKKRSAIAAGLGARMGVGVLNPRPDRFLRASTFRG